MITAFDKNGAVALYKREFAERLKEDDYEGALDRLLKYSEATENPDFHMACGMLYLVMSQSSDDREIFNVGLPRIYGAYSQVPRLHGGIP